MFYDTFPSEAIVTPAPPRCLCENGGYCSDSNNPYSCVCPQLYTGRICENRKYRKIFSIRHTNSQNLSGSRLVLQLSLPNPLKPSVKSKMKMYLEQRRQAMLQLHLR